MLTIIGCGNTNRSDDGVGVHVVRQLKQLLSEQPRENVRVFDAGTGGMEVMFQARGATELLIIDASKTGSPPGSIFEVPGEELASEHDGSLSLHDFRWDHALYAGRRIFKNEFPERVHVFLIEAGSLDLGLDLSEVVRKAADTVIARIRELIYASEAGSEAG